MNCYFRLSSSVNLGLGHILRCMRIAKNIKKKKIYFLVDRISGNIKKLEKKNFFFIAIYKKKEKFLNEKDDAKRVINLITKNTFLFVDDFRLSAKWHSIIIKKTKKLIVIDDDFNKKFNCDYYINYKNLNKKEIKLIKKNNINPKTKFLLGLKYCIFYYNLKKNFKLSNKSFKIFISFGNSFDINKILNILKSILKINKKIKIILSLGFFSKSKVLLRKKNLIYINRKIGIAKELNNSHLFIGSSGGMIYETSYLNLPSIFFSLNSNQVNDISSMEKIGHYFFLEKIDINKCNKISDLVKVFFKNYSRIQKMNSCKKNILDKKGVKRILQILKIN